MITQERLEQALKFLSETDEQHAKLTAGVDYLKDLSKNIIDTQEKEIQLMKSMV